MANELTPASAQALKHATADEIMEVTNTVTEVHKSVVDANQELNVLYNTLKQTEGAVKQYNHMSKLCRSQMHNLGMMLNQ